MYNRKMEQTTVVNKRDLVTYFRPWGNYTNLEGDDNGPYKIKRIVVSVGGKLSLQTHEHRSEHWTIVNGNGIVQLGQEMIEVKKDSRIYIPKGELHRMMNTGDEELVFIEVQIGDYLGEDDIKRYEDIYGRS